MAQIVWSRRASKDLIQACEYLERDSLAYACYFADEVMKTLESAANQPYVGALVPEYGEEHFRERRVGSYRLMYEVHRDAIYVVTIVHGARGMPSERSAFSD
jgi:toxin ParE1/3/4